jgi:hypothetical protein
VSNVKAEEEIEVIMRHLAHQDELIRKVTEKLDALASGWG